jgi:tetratricopeptide (TPR) repeat protein
MLIRYLSAFLFGLHVATSVAGQSSATITRSHVERFSTVETRAERVETDATAKLETNPNDAAALNSRGVARLFLGKYQEAYGDLNRAVLLKPDNAAYQANLGSAMWKLGRYEDALSAERVAVKLDNKNFTAQYQMGRFLLRLGGSARVAEAVEHLRRAIEIDPKEYDVRFELIAAYRVLNDKVQASNQLDFLRDARPSDPRVFYTSALLATDRNDFETAIKDFKDALRRDPTLYSAWQDLGVAYTKLNRSSEAVDAFSELVRLRPNSVDAAYLHALSFFNAGRTDEAEREARRALKINVGAAEAHTLLGVILASRGSANAEAAETLSQAVALSQNSFDAHFYLGRVLYAVKDYEGAVKELRVAVTLKPNSAEARFFLGTALEASGNIEVAQIQYQELVKLAPDSALGQLGLGALLLKKGQTDEAFKALERAIALDSKNFEAHLAMGRALARREKFLEAVEVLKTAVQLGPYRPDAHYQLGLALQRIGRKEDAAFEFATVEKLNSEFRSRAVPRQ